MSIAIKIAVKVCVNITTGDENLSPTVMFIFISYIFGRWFDVYYPNDDGYYY